MSQYLALPATVAGYYSGLLKSAPTCAVSVVLHSIKGKCLVASKPLQKGDVILEEPSLCCTLNMDSIMRIPRSTHSTCGGCLGKGNDFPCPAACGDVFCSASCHAQAAHHPAICKAGPNLFTLSLWHQAGIDYSDTALLASKILTSVVERSRREKVSLADAWMPYSLFASEPLDRFHFGYLVNKDENEAQWDDSSEDDRKGAMRKTFKRYKYNPSRDPGIIAANDRSDMSKDFLVGKLSDVLRGCVPDITDEERDFLSPFRVSLTLGLVLQNSQTRYPSDKDVEAQACFAIGSCFNHSCDPNVKVGHGVPRNERMHAVALKDILEGEECCISYLDETKSFEERQWYLFDHYLFDCVCPKCEAEK